LIGQAGDFADPSIERLIFGYAAQKEADIMTWQQLTAAYMPAPVIMVTIYIATVS